MSNVCLTNSVATIADASRRRRHQHLHISPLVWWTSRLLPGYGFRRILRGGDLPVLLDELDEKLRTKFEVAPKDAVLIRTRLAQAALVLEPEIVLSVVKDDPDDDRVLECAIAGKVDYVVSGDRHLLKLESYEGIPILTVRQFMDRF